MASIQTRDKERYKSIPCREAERCPAQPSSETPPPAADGNRFRDPQPERVLRALSPKQDVSPTNPSPRTTLQKRRQVEGQSLSAWRTPNKQSLLKQQS